MVVPPPWNKPMRLTRTFPVKVMTLLKRHLLNLKLLNNSTHNPLEHNKCPPVLWDSICRLEDSPTWVGVAAAISTP